jgi:hypothetical protein
VRLIKCNEVDGYNTMIDCLGGIKCKFGDKVPVSLGFDSSEIIGKASLSVEDGYIVADIEFNPEISSPVISDDKNWGLAFMPLQTSEENGITKYKGIEAWSIGYNEKVYAVEEEK